MDEPLSKTLIMGTSSERGDICILDGVSGVVRVLEKARPHHGIYGASRANGAALFGSRAGQLLYTDDLPSILGGKDRFQTIEQRGSEIIDVHLGMARKALACDRMGVTLWNLDSPIRKTALSTAGQVVACVCLLNHQGYGLSTDGSLLTWEVPSGHLTAHRNLPPPPKKSALVRLIHVGDWNALIYPAAGGRLVLFNPEDGSSGIVDAHEGDCYAAFESGSGLITVGRSDGTLKLWSGKPDCPPKNHQSPKDIVAGAAFFAGSERIALVDSRGVVYLGSLKDGSFVEELRLPGAACRVIAGPDQATLRREIGRAQESEIRWIVEKIPSVSPTELEPLLHRLSELGAEELVLEARIEAALRRSAGEPEAVLQALEFQKRQASLLPDHPDAVTLLRRYADTLERVSVYSVACEVWLRIERIDSTQEARSRLEAVRRHMNDLRAGKYLTGYNAGIPFPIVCRTHSMHSAPMFGMFAVQPLRTLESGLVSLAPQRLVTKYCGCAQIDNLTWHRDGNEIQTDTFVTRVAILARGIEVLIVIPIPAGLVQLSPEVALQAASTSSAPDDMLAAYEQLRQGAFNCLIQGIFDRIHDAIGKAANEIDSERLSEEEEDK